MIKGPDFKVQRQRTHLIMLKKYILCIYFFSSSFVFANIPDFSIRHATEALMDIIPHCDPSYCYNEDMARFFIYGDLSSSHQILQALNDKGLMCMRFFLQAIKKEIDMYSTLPKVCPTQNQEDNKDQISCEDQQRQYQVVNDRVLSLINLMVSKDQSLILPFMQYLGRGADNDLPYMISSLMQLLQSLEDEQSCHDYRIGEERAFLISPFQGPHIDYTFYRVKRESEKHYKAIIAFNFSPAENYDYIIPRDHVHEYYMQRVRSSIAQANTKMWGPHGELLEIVIEDGRQVDVCLPQHGIEITNNYEDSRSYVNAYRPSISRPSITHEVFHALGVWDEYFDKKYNCRVVQRSTMLSRYSLRWDNVFEENFGDSLIEPVYFYSILYGNCSLRSNVKRFRKCSRLSYQSSEINPSCLEQKALCENQEILGRNKARERQRIEELISAVDEEITLLQQQIDFIPAPKREDPNYNEKWRSRQNLFKARTGLYRRRTFLGNQLDTVSLWPDPK